MRVRKERREGEGERGEEWYGEGREVGREGG